MTKMTDHYLPEFDDWGDMTTRIEQLINVPIRRVPRLDRFVEPPFVVFACTWAHRNSQGVLTREKFEGDLQGAIQDFANEVNAQGDFNAYPITHSPPTTYGVAYHDWRGGVLPFDVRCMIALDENIDTGVADAAGTPIIESGLKFHIVTLLATEEYVETIRESTRT